MEEVKEITVVKNQPKTFDERIAKVTADIEKWDGQMQELIAKKDVPKSKGKVKDINSKIKSLEDKIELAKLRLESLKDEQVKAAEKKALEDAKAKVASTEFEFQTSEGVISKKAAYIKYNRQIEEASVKYWMETIANGQYEPDCPMFVADAFTVRVNQPDMAICDADGNAIPDEELEGYVVILDGQHRSRAYMLLILLSKFQGTIPGVIVKNDIQDYAKYLRSLNGERSWTNKQKGQIIALTAPEKYKELCIAINELVLQGFSPSTASQIYTFQNHITSAQIDALLAGKEPVPVLYPNVERGNKFIAACKKAGIDVKFLKKRYFVEGFVKAISASSEEKAWAALDSLQMTPEALKEIRVTDDFTKILVDNIAK